MKGPHNFGYRGRALLALGILDLIFALNFWFPVLGVDSSASAEYAARALPILLLAILWTTNGVVSVVYAFRLYDAIGWTLSISVKIFFGVLIFIGWLAGEVPRGYLSTAVWWAFAVIVWINASWPEPDASFRPRKKCRDHRRDAERVDAGERTDIGEQ